MRTSKEGNGGGCAVRGRSCEGKTFWGIGKLANCPENPHRPRGPLRKKTFPLFSSPLFISLSHPLSLSLPTFTSQSFSLSAVWFEEFLWPWARPISAVFIWSQLWKFRYNSVLFSIIGLDQQKMCDKFKVVANMGPLWYILSGDPNIHKKTVLGSTFLMLSVMESNSITCSVLVNHWNRSSAIWGIAPPS